MDLSLVLAKLPEAVPTFVGAVVGGLIAGISVVIGQYLTHRFTRKRETEKLRQQAYAAILGKKVLLMQLYVSRFEAYIFSTYHECLWHKAGSPEGSLDIDEAKRWMHKSEDLALEVARTWQSLFESIGIAQTIFRQSKELEQLTDRLYQFQQPSLLSPPPDDIRLLIQWKDEAVRQVQEVVAREYGAPLDMLLRHLLAHMHDPVK